MRKKKFLEKGVLPFALLCTVTAVSPALGFQSLHAAAASQQQGMITGSVYDSAGEPVIGASVMVEGTSTGTITDLDGKFQLNVKPGTKLQISFIGYATVTVVAKEGMRVTMEDDSQMLGEVEVVAYGTQKKVTVTGAISSVKGDDLLKSPTGSVSNMLSGQLAGLTTVQYSGEPGDDAASIFVRGQATWENSAPLIQVDGVERSMNDIDPNEIESITILKDASATAVFGVRGANGVVLITTKRGKEGKAKISFSTSASIIAPTKTLELANSYQYATFYNQMQLNDHPDYTEKQLMFQPDVIEKFRTGSDPIRFPSTNWVDYCLKDMTLQTQHNVNISGGTDRIRYFVSAGAYTQGGLFNGFDLPYDLSYQYKRFNYRSNLDIDVTKTTTVSMNIAGNVNNAWKPYTGQGSAGMLLEMYYATPFSSPGLVDDKLVYTTTEYGLPFTGGTGMAYYGAGFMQTGNNTLNADLQLSQKLDFITKGLSFRVKGSYNSGFTSYTRATASIATYTPVLQDDGTIVYKKSGTNSQLKYQDVDPGKSRNWYMEAAFNYDRTFGNHHVTALALYNQSKTYYPSEFSSIPQGYVGLVGRATYDWKSRYMAEFNIGYNGSENFAPDKRFGTFPAGSFGWVVSEEKFWKPIKPFIGFMKLRYTIGLVGNDKIGGSRFMYTADPYYVNNTTASNLNGGYSYLFGINNATVSPGAYEAAKNNPDVTWEKSLKQNYGVDMYFLNDRLQGSFDYYKEKRTNILLSDGTAPSVLGFTLPMANLGKVDSWGWEISLKWNDRIGDDFRYFVNLNLMYNQNKIIERKEAPLNQEYQYSKGHRIGSRLQYQFFEYYDENTTPAHYREVFGTEMPTQLVDLKNGDCVYVDLDGDGAITPDDKTRDLGYTDDPEYMAGLNLGFSWKNFDFSMQWTGAWNVSRSISSIFRKPFTDRNNMNQGGLLVAQVENTWTTANPDPDAEYPRATFDNGDSNNYQDSNLWEKDAKYLRLKNLQIAYNFHFPLMERLKLSTCQLAFSGYNLLTFTPYKWGDPESRASNQPTYPLTRTFSLSLKLGF